MARVFIGAFLLAAVTAAVFDAPELAVALFVVLLGGGLLVELRKS